MNSDMNRRLMYTSVKTVKVAFTEVSVQRLNMGRMVQRNENWLSHKKKVNEILHTEKYHELRTYEAAFSRMRNNFWTDKIKKSHKIILLCAKKRLFEVHL